MAYRRPLWYYPLFQIPLLLLGLCLAMALLFWLLGWGRPSVAVSIALDLSGSTYDPQPFNAPGTIMNQEINAVNRYLEKNTSGVLSRPNQVKILGFASAVRPLTRDFSTDAKVINQELTQSIKPGLAEILGEGTNLDLAIQEGVKALKSVSDRCRELLIVTDGAVFVAPEGIINAKSNRVKINAVVIGTEAPLLQAATLATGGRYISAEGSELDQLFTEKIFRDFNNNWGWVLFWLGLAWICLMWLLVMPLDRWLFQRLLKMPINLAGKLALGNAFFWSAATPLIVWKLYQILEFALPFIGSC